MSSRKNDEQHTESRDERDLGDQADEKSPGEVELSEEGREEVKEMVEAYEDKPTVTLPGTHGTISGTAINEWLDDDGNPKFGDPDEHPAAEDNSARGDQKQSASDGS